MLSLWNKRLAFLLGKWFGALFSKIIIIKYCNTLRPFMHLLQYVGWKMVMQHWLQCIFFWFRRDLMSTRLGIDTVCIYMACPLLEAGKRSVSSLALHQWIPGSISSASTSVHLVASPNFLGTTDYFPSTPVLLLHVTLELKYLKSDLRAFQIVLIHPAWGYPL